MLTLLTVVIIFGILVLVHEFGHFVTARRIGVRVERFSIGLGPKIAGFKKNETEYLISAIPLGGYVKLAGEEPGEETSGQKWELPSRSIPERLAIFASGSLFNLLSAFVVASILFMAGEMAVPTHSNTIGSTIKDYPAQAAGLEAGDAILSIDGKTVKTWEEITALIHANKGLPVQLLVQRDKKTFSLTLLPRGEIHKDIFGRDIRRSYIGIAPETVTKRYNPVEALYLGGKMTLVLTGKIYQGLWLLITRQASFKNVAGPIGIFNITGHAARAGILPLLGLFVVISVNLAVINLLPFPVLDGGHILFLILEKLRGRPLKPQTQELVTQVALYLLVVLFVTVSYNDVARTGAFEKIGKLWKR